MKSTSESATTGTRDASTAWVFGFFVATFVITWGLQLPAVLVHEGLIEGPLERFMPFLGLSAFGPMFGAIVIVMLQDGRGGVRALFRPLRIWRVGFPLLVAAPLMSGAVFVLGRAVYGLFADDGGPFFYPPFKPEQMIAMVVFSLGEEIGWRGYALPRLQAKHGALVASVVVGLLWALWHLPMMRLDDVNDPLTLMLLIPFLVSGSVVFTWFYNRTQGSLLVAFLLHVGAHLSNPNQAIRTSVTPLVIHTAAYVVLAIVLVVTSRESWLTPRPMPAE
jgi:membrane protease YdiL (CAAX protease family)